MTAIFGGAAPGRAAVAFIFVTVVLDMLALGMIIPVLPRLVVDLMGGDTPGAAQILGLFGTAWALMQFVFSPVLGALSDRFGRRPVILLSNLGLGLDYVVMALAPNLGWLFAGRVLSGVTAASISTAYSYIADVTEPAKRSAAFGMLGAAFGLGFVLGPAIGGLLGGMDPRLPFWAAAGASLLNALYGYLILPESLPPDRRSPFMLRKANPVGAIAMLTSKRELARLAAAQFLSQLAHVALPSVFVLYASYRYHWDERGVGLTLAAVGVASMIVQGGLTGPIVRRIGERATMLLGLFAGAAGFAIYGLAETGTWFWAGIPVMALWGLASSAIQGQMTARVEPTEQGRLQGAIASLQGIAGLIGPGLFTLVFAYFIGNGAGWHVPGAAFLLAASMLAIAGAIGLMSTSSSRMNTR